MRGIITAPKNVITGAFNVLFAFQRAIDFTTDDFRVDVLSGDALGHPRDRLIGSGANRDLLCYLRKGIAGRSRISVVKDGVLVRPVEIEYDTVRTVQVTWGQPLKVGKKIEIPLTLDAPLMNLRKSVFAFSKPIRFYLYGTDATYTLVTAPTPETEFRVSVSGAVQKANGSTAVLTGSALAVDFSL